MVGYDERRSELEALDVGLIAASAASAEDAREIADTVFFPVGYGVTRAQADELGSWWEERRQIIQPSGFVLAPDGRILASCYSDGPLGRLDAEDVVRFVTAQKK